MFSIGDYFKKFRNIQAKEIFIRSAVKDSFKKHIKIDIAIEKVSFKGNIITVKGLNSSQKSSLFTKREIILREVIEITGLKGLKNIFY